MASFETIHLTTAKEDVACHVSKRVSHIRQTHENGAIKFHTNVGGHLATLTDAALESDATESKLRYRTAYIRPHPFHAHNKAREIRDAVEQSRTSPHGR